MRKHECIQKAKIVVTETNVTLNYYGILPRAPCSFTAPPVWAGSISQIAAARAGVVAAALRPPFWRRVLGLGDARGFPTQGGLQREDLSWVLSPWALVGDLPVCGSCWTVQAEDCVMSAVVVGGPGGTSPRWSSSRLQQDPETSLGISPSGAG